jgi:hypothetical protein
VTGMGAPSDLASNLPDRADTRARAWGPGGPSPVTADRGNPHVNPRADFRRVGGSNDSIAVAAAPAGVDNRV